MEFLWTAPDGAAFPAERWTPSGQARAVLLCLHGMSGAATDFQALAEPLSQIGMAAFAINLRGQGNDPTLRRRGTELNLAQVERDVRAFAAEAMAAYPGLPVFWCGESMGSLILMHLLAQRHFDLPVQGAIFSAPVVGLRKHTPLLVRQVLGLVARVAPRLRLHPGLFVTKGGEPLRVTRDEAFRAKNRASSHFIPVFSLGFLDSLGTLIESSFTLAGLVKAPCLVLAAERDVFVDSRKVAEWYERLGSQDKSLHIYPEAYHCLWNDHDRELVLADIRNWLEPRI